MTAVLGPATVADPASYLVSCWAPPGKPNPAPWVAWRPMTCLWKWCPQVGHPLHLSRVASSSGPMQHLAGPGSETWKRTHRASALSHHCPSVSSLRCRRWPPFGNYQKDFGLCHSFRHAHPTSHPLGQPNLNHCHGCSRTIYPTVLCRLPSLSSHWIHSMQHRLLVSACHHYFPSCRQNSPTNLPSCCRYGRCLCGPNSGRH